MPVHLGSKGYGGSGGDAGERLPMLERELGKLRREVEALKGQTTDGMAQGVLTRWMSTALAAVGVLLGLMALIRH